MGPPVTRRPTGSEAARGSGGASASWMLFMKLSSEVSVGTPVCLAAHWVPQNEAPSALGLTEGPRKSRAGVKHTTFPKDIQKRVSCGVSTRLHLLFMVFPMFSAPCNRYPPQLPSSFWQFPDVYEPTLYYFIWEKAPSAQATGEPARSLVAKVG